MLPCVSRRSRLLLGRTRRSGKWVLVNNVDFWGRRKLFVVAARKGGLELKFALTQRLLWGRVADPAPSDSIWRQQSYNVLGGTFSGPLESWLLRPGWTHSSTGLDMSRAHSEETNGLFWKNLAPLLSPKIRQTTHTPDVSRSTTWAWVTRGMLFFYPCVVPLLPALGARAGPSGRKAAGSPTTGGRRLGLLGGDSEVSGWFFFRTRSHFGSWGVFFPDEFLHPTGRFPRLGCDWIHTSPSDRLWQGRQPAVSRR